MEWFNGDLAILFAVNAVILLAVLFAVRWLSGVSLGKSTIAELAQKDNVAFGIFLAASTLAMGIMLSGVAGGGFASTPGEEAAVVAAHIGAGLVLMGITRFIFDRLALPNVSIGRQVIGGNCAVAIVDGGNLIATAVMVRAIMDWTGGSLVASLIGLGVGYVGIQVLLTAVMSYRVHLFGQRNEGKSFREAVAEGNIALAVRFAGFQLGMALAATAASGIQAYDPAGDPALQALDWTFFAAMAMIVAGILTWVAEKAVLRGVDVSQEVDRERNIGVGLVEAAIYAAIGLMATSLIAG